MIRAFKFGSVSRQELGFGRGLGNSVIVMTTLIIRCQYSRFLSTVSYYPGGVAEETDNSKNVAEIVL